MPAMGGPPVQITHNGGEFGIESEDGKTLYFTPDYRRRLGIDLEDAHRGRPGSVTGGLALPL